MSNVKLRGPTPDMISRRAHSRSKNNLFKLTSEEALADSAVGGTSLIRPLLRLCFMFSGGTDEFSLAVRAPGVGPDDPEVGG